MVHLVTVLGFAAFLYAGSAWALAPAAPPPAVGVVKAEKTPIVVTDRFIGRIQAVQRYNVVARVTAFLDEVVFKEGQEVKEGDVLYRLEQSPFEADVEAKQGAIAVHGSVEISSQMKPIEAAADPGAPPRRTG